MNEPDPRNDDDARPHAGPGIPLWISLWFGLDAIVALAPPLYWVANGRTAPVLGLPAALCYFLAVGLCITASIVAAWLADRVRVELAA